MSAVAVRRDRGPWCDRGRILPAGGPLPTTGAASDGVLEQLRREWLIGYGSVNTRTAYDGDLTNWLTFLDHSGVDPLTATRTVHAHAWLRTLEAAGEAPATRGRRLAAVSAFYKWLISEGHTERANPAAIDAKRKPSPSHPGHRRRPRSPATKRAAGPAVDVEQARVILSAGWGAVCQWVPEPDGGRARLGVVQVDQQPVTAAAEVGRAHPGHRE